MNIYGSLMDIFDEKNKDIYYVVNGEAEGHYVEL